MNFPLVEALEPRIAPATLTAGNTVLYTDSDGDSVAITHTKGIFDLTQFDFVASGMGEQLQKITLDGTFAKGDITVSVIGTVVGSDGKADVGFINAAGVDLATVIVSGDLGRIIVGDADPATASLKTLQVDSFGFKGLTTQAAGGDLKSEITGKVGKLIVPANGHGIKDAFVHVTGGLTNGGIGTVDITGDIQGGGSADSGAIKVEGTIKKLLLHGSIVGAGGDRSGSLTVDGTLASAIIDGDIKGGTADHSGSIKVGGILKKLTVTDLEGGTGAASTNTGQISSGGDMGSVTIKGTVLGGDEMFSGYVDCAGLLKKIAINGLLMGGAGADSGVVFGGKGIKTMTVGSITNGAGNHSGAVKSMGLLSSLTVGTDLAGTDATHSVNISATGDIKKLIVQGSVSFANILAGYDNLTPTNGNAKIGTVNIFGNLDTTNIVAGVQDVGANGFGNADDVSFNVPAPDGIFSTISKIIIGGVVNPTAGQFGFTAELVKSVVLGPAKTKVVLLKGAHTDTAGIDAAQGITIREVA